MDSILILKLLFLLCVANGAPIALKILLGNRWAQPLDQYYRLSDGRRVFGTSKTWRGLLGSLLLTGGCAQLIGVDFMVGMLFALASMAGDMFSSFIKRRLALASSSMALGLDQIPEALFPLFVFYTYFSLTIIDVLTLVVLFFVGELLLSRLLFALHLRDRPY